MFSSLLPWSKELRSSDFFIKNWPNDPTIGFEAKGRSLKNVDEFGEANKKILNILDAKFPNEVKDYVKEYV
jgi:hypothetical protein